VRPAVLQAAARSGNLEGLILLLDNQKSAEPRVSLGQRLLEFGAHSGKVEMLKFILEQAGFPMDDDDTKEKRWKGEQLTEEQMVAIENILWRVVTQASLDSVQLLLSHLTPRNEDCSFPYYEIKN
jgi:hypothetical protein